MHVLREELEGGFGMAAKNHGTCTASHEYGTFATWVATFVDIFLSLAFCRNVNR